ncbi:MAG TPA: hypothetical protein VLH40_00225 [Atribacteraceae bacterium]|nr:hypothetical protein [Atribacteraceae bacterium]
MSCVTRGCSAVSEIDNIRQFTTKHALAGVVALMCKGEKGKGMKNTKIVEAFRQKLTILGGRQLYGVLGTYSQFDGFAKKLHQAKAAAGDLFPKPVNVNRGILDTVPDDEFKQLAENETRRPEPTAAHVARAFERVPARKNSPASLCRA